MNLVSYEFVACQAEKKGVLILSEFAGAAQSLGAGAILVNPWNIAEVAAAIGDALRISECEREKRHRHNFKHVTTHTSQEWAETFVSELNDAIDEAQLITRQIPPIFPTKDSVEQYLKSKNRLIIQGFNASLTEAADNQERRIDQFHEMELKLHPLVSEPLEKICEDPHNIVIILSGSDRAVLDKNFSEYNLWLAAEHGMFLRHTKGEWMTTMPECLQMDWVESVKHVFEYFTERTPRSHFELRQTSLVWNYKYSDVEFGRLQSKDLLQHLWAGPISNASLDVVQGARSVEARAVGVTKGAAIDRILGEIIHKNNIKSPIDYVLCVGHFLPKDEDIYTFFDPELPERAYCPSKTKTMNPANISAARFSGRRNMWPLSLESFQSVPAKDNKTRSCNSNNNSQFCSATSTRDRMTLVQEVGSSVLDLKAQNYFSCAVGRKRSTAKYLLGSSSEVVQLLTQLADCSSSHN